MSFLCEVISTVDDKAILFECIECNQTEIVPSWDFRKDGRHCLSCGGKLDPKGFTSDPKRRWV